MPLDPQAKMILKQLQNIPPVTPDTDPETVRRTYVRLPMSVEPVHAVADSSFHGPGGEIPVRIYTPCGTPPFPVLVYYHGGGWVIGDLDSHDDLCRALANRADTLVVSVDYRLAPEHKFPAAVEDAYATLHWVREQSGSLQADPARIAVGGDSAGGNLAAVVSYLAREQSGPRPTAQVLIYPAVTASEEMESRRLFGAGYLLTQTAINWFIGHYLNHASEMTDPRVSPLAISDLRGLPQALVITAEYDPLRDEGEQYAARLYRAGVPVTQTRYPGMIHDFVRLFRVLDEGQKAVQQIADFLRDVFK
jgi:acetyl esterase